MTEWTAALAWTAGYRAALADFATLAGSRGLASPGLTELLSDLEQDAGVIEHESNNKKRRRRLRAEREAEYQPRLLP